MKKQLVEWDFETIAEIYNNHLDSEALKSQILIAEPHRYAFGRKESIEEHLQMLAHEFHEKSLLEFCIPWLTVRLRRKIDVAQNWEKFWDLITQNSDYLSRSLDLRWIVSIADSVIDNSTDQIERNISLSILLLLNTIKFYETERFATGQKDSNIEYAPIPGGLPIDLGLNGLSAFCIGYGDAMQNLINRISLITRSDAVMNKFLVESINRIQSLDTVYRRFSSACH